MNPDDDIVTISVPVGVASLYLVPTSTPPADPADAALAAVDDLPQPLRRTASLMLGEEWLTVEVVPAATEMIAPRLLALFGATPEQLAAIGAATHVVRVRGIGKPWWQPYHDWAARGVAARLAVGLGADVIDRFTPRVLTVEQAWRSLPDEDEAVVVTDWVRVTHSRGAQGDWFTTLGLRRYGLPELQSASVPGPLTEAWTDVLCGIVVRVLDEWRVALRGHENPSFVEFPAVLSVSEADVARAFGGAPRGGGSAKIRLRLDPPDDPEKDAVLSVLPPDPSSSAGAYFAEVCAAVFGLAGDVQRRERDDAMDAAIAAARAELPTARARFLGGGIEPGARLIVKHRLPVAGPGSEFVWAAITDWPEPDRLVGTSLNDAESDPAVRVGGTVRVPADAIIDWALWRDGVGIVEGGWTDRLIGS